MFSVLPKVGKWGKKKVMESERDGQKQGREIWAEKDRGPSLLGAPGAAGGVLATLVAFLPLVHAEGLSLTLSALNWPSGTSPSTNMPCPL